MKYLFNTFDWKWMNKRRNQLWQIFIRFHFLTKHNCEILSQRTAKTDHLSTAKHDGRSLKRSDTSDKGAMQEHFADVNVGVTIDSWNPTPTWHTYEHPSVHVCSPCQLDTDNLDRVFIRFIRSCRSEIMRCFFEHDGLTTVLSSMNELQRVLAFAIQINKRQKHWLENFIIEVLDVSRKVKVENV